MKKYWILIFTLCFATVLNAADSSKMESREPLFKDGKGYYSYHWPRQIELPKEGKVLIRYFYHYGCEPCVSAEDNIRLFVKQNPEKVEYVRSPSFENNKVFTAQLNAMFMAYGRPELSEQFLFDSTSTKDRSLVEREEAVMAWLQKKGVDLAKFNELAKSTQVKQQIEQDLAIYQQHAPPLIPMATIDGKYILVRNTLYNDDYTYAVLDFLVEKRQQERQEDNK